MRDLSFWGSLFAAVAMMAAPVAFPMGQTASVLVFLCGLAGFVLCCGLALKRKKGRPMTNTGRPRSAGIYIEGDMKGWTIEGNSFIGGDAAVHVGGNVEDNVFAGNRLALGSSTKVSRAELDRIRGVLQAITDGFRPENGRIPNEDEINGLLEAGGENWRIRQVDGDHWEMFEFKN